MDTALKLARHYFLEKGEPERTHFIARKPSYHGNTLGALGVSGHEARKMKYRPILANNCSHVSPAYAYRWQRQNESEDTYVYRLAQELNDEFQRVGPSKVGAFVAEPVVGAAMGCVTAPKGYFPAVKKVCERYGALLILDEVMCGTGRTGTLHAWQHEDVGVVPDIQTMGKGLGGGYIPISAVLVGQKVVNTMTQGGIFTNGQTYQGHPVACAGALAVQKIIKEESLLDRVTRIGAKLEKGLNEALNELPNVGNIRGRGLFWGIEIVQSRQTKQPFPSELQISERISEQVLELGMSLYPCTGFVDGVNGDAVILAPAYTIMNDDVEFMILNTKSAIQGVMKNIDGFDIRAAASTNPSFRH